MFTGSFVPQTLIEYLLFESPHVRNGSTRVQNTPFLRISQSSSSNPIGKMVKDPLRPEGQIRRNKEVRRQGRSWEKWEGEAVWMKQYGINSPRKGFGGFGN